ncbi:Thiamine-monophosphate kinase [Acinetobacter haemolyticus CIP 64.3 = MTCC 9819]|uniref:Thiamine-monophosphate kinase n=1 Tax=Acinetobacter haemolyticus CIP 64.3 = MTCC 9819 TaxID=1217659 RepID=N9FC63_ACIHA|nr:thiamine-phosphate kinase [Acinetobacter haemolyticus]ENW20413.1 thiamine-monophosphate kinase [Acinetobacter haemolyticus CIP 64.3 = MTCC 9819]EPR89678.1 Thiamine-monophosphate kinase [Acinetobacter haemolyticus CIP 64.3 = MTCC 9819]QXZ27641.1 thiamine-phosphate kinase [Acinetobacter haemolyticus]SPT45947.1 thiamin-monophosphate kinase [Acinetobacter haemolyticus]SUU53958.1 thiamin-monophosphate kinase [Acinetobacter haemolyticus]
MAEFSIIDQYFKRPSNVDVSLGIGDDSAIVTPPPAQQLVICTDTLVAGRHFPLNTSAHAIGWKSVAVNLSDLAAMGAKPHSILLALSLPTIDHEWLAEFSRGLFECCDQFGVSLIGGDTTQSTQLTMSVTALGWIEQGQAVTRAGAQVGDYICVSGQVGDAAFGLQHLGHPLQQRLDYPTPRCELGQQLKGLASSMIDVSDGLAQDLGHILKASNKGATLQLDQLPIDESLKSLETQKAWHYALAGGDDYELCFTISPQNYEKLLRQPLDVPLTIIGEITQQTGLLFEYMGETYPLHVHGYQHFA